VRRILLNAKGWVALAEEAQYKAKTLAALCNVSSRQLQREFKRQLGRPPQDWLDEQRIIVAGSLLLSGNPIKKVASELGFKQSSHFCRQFKSKNKMTPSEFVLFHLQRIDACRSQITNVAQG